MEEQQFYDNITTTTTESEPSSDSSRPRRTPNSYLSITPYQIFFDNFTIKFIGRIVRTIMKDGMLLQQILALDIENSFTEKVDEDGKKKYCCYLNLVNLFRMKHVQMKYINFAFMVDLSNGRKLPISIAIVVPDIDAKIDLFGEFRMSPNVSYFKNDQKSYGCGMNQDSVTINWNNVTDRYILNVGGIESNIVYFMAKPFYKKRSIRNTSEEQDDSIELISTDDVAIVSENTEETEETKNGN